MKRFFPVLFSMIACLFLLRQMPAAKNTLHTAALPEDVSDKIVKAQKQLLKALRQAKTDPAAVADAQKTLQAARATIAPQPNQNASAASAIKVAPATEVAALGQAVNELAAQADPLAQSAAALESGLIWAALGLGFISSILATFNWNRLSAAASALVVLASGIPNVYPVHDRSAYYQTLSNQSHSLIAALALSPQLTLDEYDNDVRREAILENALTFPGVSNGDPTAGLMSSLDAAKISTFGG